MSPKFNLVKLSASVLSGVLGLTRQQSVVTWCKSFEIRGFRAVSSESGSSFQNEQHIAKHCRCFPYECKQGVGQAQPPEKFFAGAGQKKQTKDKNQTLNLH